MGQSESKPRHDARVVIVGGVAAGASCAARCRRLSETAKITMIEKGPYVSFANCGLPYYVGDVIHDEDKLLVSKPALFRDRFGIDVMVETEALSVDAAKRVVRLKNYASGEEHEIEYDYLVLATGSKPIRPPLPGIDKASVFSVRDIPDARHIKEHIERTKAKRAAVVGAGFVGLEMVENLVGLGCAVDLIEGLPQIMGPLDPEMAALVEPVLAKHKVGVYLGERVAAFEDGPGGEDGCSTVVVTAAGTRFPCDLVILGIGVRPALGLARSAGITIGERGGIVVDKHMRTSDPHIFAAGDGVESTDVVTGAKGIVPLAGPANRQGRIVANNIFGAEPSAFRGTQGTAICGLFDCTIAMTGASEKSLRRAGIPYEYIYLHPSNHASYYPGAHQMHIKLLFSPEGGKVLGAQVVGGSAGVDKRVDVFSVAIQAGLTVYDLEEVDLCYAPQYGSAKDPINFAGMVAANTLRGLQSVAHWPDALKQHEKGEATLLDCRTPDEFDRGHVPGALNISVNELRDNLAKVPTDKPLLVYCQVGIRGYLACRILQQLGFDDVKNITGGWLSYPSALEVAK